MPQKDFSSLDDQARAELWSVLALHELKGLNVAARSRLVNHFGSPYSAVSGVKAWEELGVKPEVVNRYERGTWREQARINWELIRNSAVNVLLYSDPAYPVLLKEIADPPLVLFYLGDLSLLNNTSVGVVGARNCTREGMSVAVNIVRGLTRAGVTSISGMAKGIDRVVHLAGLEGPGSSIAVLGSGVDVPYPKGNLDLYDLLKDKGLIISEFMPGAEPMTFNFPVRNRIISGLSRAVLVVEAAVRSGTLITARHAAEQGRDVYAVPGSNVSETSEGCRDLIRRGATPVFTAEDVLLELSPILKAELEEKLHSRGESASKISASLDEKGILPWAAQGRQPSRPPNVNKPSVQPIGALELEALCAGLDSRSAAILKILNQRPNCHIDVICNKLGIEVAGVSGSLTVLEVKGLVTRLPGMYYSISK